MFQILKHNRGEMPYVKIFQTRQSNCTLHFEDPETHIWMEPVDDAKYSQGSKMCGWMGEEFRSWLQNVTIAFTA